MRKKEEFKILDSEKQFLGVGFIKSRKLDDKVIDMSEEMIASAASKSIKLLEVIVDNSSGRDVDRDKIDHLTAWMEKDYIDAIVVRSIFDITRDIDALLIFMTKAEKLNVAVYSIEVSMNLAYIPWDGGFGC